MKKIFFLVIIISMVKLSYSQNSDDGFITGRLSINSFTQSKLNSLIEGFRNGLNKVRTGQLTSDVSVTEFYKTDLSSFPKIEALIANSKTDNESADYSRNFLEKLSKAINKSESSATSIMDVRSEFLNIAVSPGLSVKEAEALAAIDLCTQELANSYELDSFESATYGNLNSSIFKGEVECADSDIFFGDNYVYAEENIKGLPRWVRCGLGTIGSAIVGGFQGVVAGVRVGGQLGGAIGGITGVVAGTFTGVARYCN